LTAYGPLGSPYRPYKRTKSTKGILLDDPMVKKLAAKYKKTNAQILIRFQVKILFNTNIFYTFSNCHKKFRFKEVF
jgi:diketogulonate reductase-like aldo/keto reductase